MFYANNPVIESKKRLHMAYLLLTNPQLINIIQNTGGHFFHGTNANALPSILKYGINSINKSTENNIDVITGEAWSRRDGKRDFVSLTDCIDVALRYAYTMEQNEDNTMGDLLNFGVVFGISLEEMNDVNTVRVQSDMPEVGVLDNLSMNHIKYILVPEDKVEFVQKLVGQKGIEVLQINMKDKFLRNDRYYQLLEILEQEYGKEDKSEYPTYYEDDVRPIVYGRSMSKIRQMFKKLKENVSTFINRIDLDEGEER